MLNEQLRCIYSLKKILKLLLKSKNCVSLRSAMVEENRKIFIEVTIHTLPH